MEAVESELRWPTYLDPTRLPYPFCPGCSHGLVLDRLNAALVRLQLDPRKVVIVSDIGCSGLSDQYFITNAFHGLHGRSVTYASGIKLANPDLKVVVIMGDGGAGIGGHHLINAARRNIGITVLLLNNFNFGMTGGQHSVTTPHGATTATTRLGNLEYPLDLCGIVAASGGRLVVRATAFDPELSDWIAEAIAGEGFAFFDIWELCTAYFVPSNRLTRRGLEAAMAERGLSRGIVHREERAEYSRAYRELVAAQAGQRVLSPQPLPTRYESGVRKKTHIVIAGAAGQKIRSTATILGRAAVLAGLWATQRDDYPVTVQTGHSVSEVILSLEEIHYTGIPSPDLMLVLAPEGLKVARRTLERLGPQARLYIRSDLLPVETEAQLVPLALASVGKKDQAMMALAALVGDTGLLPLEALREAITVGQKAEVARENLAALEAGVALLGQATVGPVSAT
jgi:pyruvate/2-oxoacid:ferredoxin oxidoreductase beta subunit/Pyruvate/2-oxoacid:ferredoxin oxidoreductase gamma subunit